MRPIVVWEQRFGFSSCSWGISKTSGGVRFQKVLRRGFRRYLLLGNDHP